MEVARAGLPAHQEGRADLRRRRAEHQRRRDAPAVGDAARGQDRDPHGAHDLGDERQRAGEHRSAGRRKLPRCPPASKPEAHTRSTPFVLQRLRLVDRGRGADQRRSPAGAPPPPSARAAGRR